MASLLKAQHAVFACLLLSPVVEGLIPRAIFPAKAEEMTKVARLGSDSNVFNSKSRKGTTFLKATPLERRSRGGGRAPENPDYIMSNKNESETHSISEESDTSWLKPVSTESEARLTVVQITDVYTLENFPSLKTLIQTIKSGQQADSDDGNDNHNNSNKVISMLTGDFLAPYLLSSVDRGAGMMGAIAATPIDYLTWGNHEADIDHRTVCKRVQDYPGIWLNTNMQDHEAMDAQQPYDIITIESKDGTNCRRIGLLAVLSDDKDLYSSFKAPGAFGGAKIENPWDTLAEYKTKLEAGDDSTDDSVDVILPLQHTYVPDDHKTCREFDFPVILSGHDHHKVDEVVDGTRLLKPGLDGIYATVLEMSWNDQNQPGNSPTIRARFVRVNDYAPDPELQKQTDAAYDVLLPLRNTELARVPPTFEPLSSCNSRGCVCTMGRFICSLLKSSLNTVRRQRDLRIDAVLLMGGNIRGGTEYPKGSFFSLEALESEIKSDEVIGVVPIPGYVLADGIEATHAGDPIPGWMQYDDGIQQNQETGKVIAVDNQPIDPDRTYRVGTKITDLTNGQSPTLTDYFRKHPELLPAKGSYVNIQSELMSFFARNLWRKMWEATEASLPQTIQNIEQQERNNEYASDEDESDSISEFVFQQFDTKSISDDEGNVNDDDDDDILCGVDYDDCCPEGRLSTLDQDRDGIITVNDIHVALRDLLGLSIDDKQMSLAEYVHSFADTDNNGVVNIDDMKIFCTEMPQMYENQKWRLAFPKPAIDVENDNSVIPAAK